MTITVPSPNTNWVTVGGQMLDCINGTGGRIEVTDQINARICPEKGRNRRTTDSSTFTTTNVRILSTIASVINGRSYRVIVGGEIVVAAAGAATVQTEMRFTTDNTEPLVSSSILGRGFVVLDPGGIPTYTSFFAEFQASATGFLRVAICSQRVSGAVACQWNGASGREMLLSIDDIGPTISTSGTVY